jgi:hypothetical protein
MVLQSKAVPVTGCCGPYNCEMLRITHCLDSRLADGGEVVSPPRWVVLKVCGQGHPLESKGY